MRYYFVILLCKTIPPLPRRGGGVNQEDFPLKRYIAGLACAATAVLGVPALASTAHAQAADPISALKSQLKSGNGVAFVDTLKIRSGKKSTILAHRKGELQFGASGVEASDHTTQLRFEEDLLAFDTEENTFGAEEDDIEKTETEKDLDRLFSGLTEPERVVRVKNKAYIWGGAFGQFLPQDKPWLVYPQDTFGLTGSLGQFVNPTEPATLKALLAHATVKRPTAYSGKITFGELHKVSPWFRVAHEAPLSKQQAKLVVNWRLFLNADRLPVRLTTSSSDFANGPTSTIDTRYSGWGSKVTIDAPPADQISTMKELNERFAADTPIPLLTVK
ncbi:hypothetical protein [Streptosporangium vulgare]|uniref:Uncharacterized protein n=1 Tax=Streptosporangium vulgare TaxID=46190 RepID=A0ABV5TK05_9ACTN